MNKQIVTTILLLLIVTGTIARQCYKCTACPKPFKGNEAGVTKIDVGDNNYCQKTITPVLNTENRDDGGADCKPLDKLAYCCKGNLCNGAITGTWSVKLLMATASLFFAMRLLH